MREKLPNAPMFDTPEKEDEFWQTHSPLDFQHETIGVSKQRQFLRPNSTRKEVFVIMPFSSTKTCKESEWTDIYKSMFKPAIEECGYSCQKAEPNGDNFIERIINANIVLADLTDNNPDVFFVLGVRHALSNRTIIVAQDIKHIPSYFRGWWCILYGSVSGEVARFKDDIKRIISDI